VYKAASGTQYEVLVEISSAAIVVKQINEDFGDGRERGTKLKGKRGRGETYISGG